MIDPQVAFDKLSNFETEHELANFFREEGITGRRKSHDRCPIAQWMKQTTGMRTSVGPHISPMDARSKFYAYTPDVLLEFIIKFDRGDYPELEGK
jgi:hypothetical protein